MKNRNTLYVLNVSLMYYFLKYFRFIFYLLPIVLVKVIVKESGGFSSNFSFFIVFEIILVILAIFFHIAFVFAELFRIYLYDFNYFYFKEKINQYDNIIKVNYDESNIDLYDDIIEPKKIKNGIIFFTFSLIVSLVLSIFLILTKNDFSFFIVLFTVSMFFYLKIIKEQFNLFKNYYSFLEQ